MDKWSYWGLMMLFGAAIGIASEAVLHPDGSGPLRYILSVVCLFGFVSCASVIIAYEAMSHAPMDGKP